MFDQQMIDGSYDGIYPARSMDISSGTQQRPLEMLPRTRRFPAIPSRVQRQLPLSTWHARGQGFNSPTLHLTEVTAELRLTIPSDVQTCGSESLNYPVQLPEKSGGDACLFRKSSRTSMFRGSRLPPASQNRSGRCHRPRAGHLSRPSRLRRQQAEIRRDHRPSGKRVAHRT